METKLNTGVLFKNNKKSESHPDMKGKININGKELEIAGWSKKDKNGNVYLSLKVSEPFKPASVNTGGNFRIDSKDDLSF